MFQNLNLLILYGESKNKQFQIQIIVLYSSLPGIPVVIYTLG